MKTQKDIEKEIEEYKELKFFIIMGIIGVGILYFTFSFPFLTEKYYDLRYLYYNWKFKDNQGDLSFYSNLQMLKQDKFDITINCDYLLGEYNISNVYLFTNFTNKTINLIYECKELK